MVVEVEFAIKVEAQVSPNRFRGDDGVFYKC